MGMLEKNLFIISNAFVLLFHMALSYSLPGEDYYLGVTLSHFLDLIFILFYFLILGLLPFHYLMVLMFYLLYFLFSLVVLYYLVMLLLLLRIYYLLALPQLSYLLFLSFIHLLFSLLWFYWDLALDSSFIHFPM